VTFSSSFDGRGWDELSFEDQVHALPEYSRWEGRNSQMIKIVIMSISAIALVIFSMRFLPTLRFQIQRILQNPFVRATLFIGLWRLVQFLILRRSANVQ